MKCAENSQKNNINRNNFPICLKISKTNGAFAPTAICRGKAIRSHSFPARAGDLSRCERQLPWAIQHISRRAEQCHSHKSSDAMPWLWTSFSWQPCPDSHFHNDRHSHHREFYCNCCLVSSHTGHDEVNCRNLCHPTTNYTLAQEATFSWNGNQRY